MNTDFRALCARMADELDHYRQLLTDNRLESHPLSAEARAALSAPEQGPTDEELNKMAWNWFCQSRSTYSMVWQVDAWRAFARAVLARWGRPAVEPVPVSEWHEDIGDALWWRFPIEEPPYVGSPLDTDWPGHHTHFTLLPVPEEVSQ